MLSRVEASLVDDVGVLYEGERAFYRCIQPESEEWAQEVMESGLIDHLVSEGLFPATRISDRKIEGHRLVLAHERVGVPTYPFEWSPEMLRTAGLCVAKVNDLCNQYGYELKDAHPFNVVFDGCRPVFVDFGSIAKLPERNRPDWKAASEFERSFQIPLYLYERGADAFFRNAFLAPGKSYAYSDFLAFRFTLIRWLPARLKQLIFRVYDVYKRYAVIDLSKDAQRLGSRARKALQALQESRLIPLSRQSSGNLGKKLSKLNLLRRSVWGEYQADAGFIDPDGGLLIDDRFQHIVDLVKALKPRQLTELAGNQGVLAEYLASLSFVDRVVCCDVDEQAIDRLFERVRSRPSVLNPMVLDVMLPLRTAFTKPVGDRIRGDLVIALAVTHHLSLSQGYGFECIFKTICQYTRQYAIVEFMPLGLWDGTYSPPLPEWYSEDDFRKGLRPFFSVIESKQVQENRIIYLLEKKTDAEQEVDT